MRYGRVKISNGFLWGGIIFGLENADSSVVPPLVYAVMGSSTEMVVAPAAVVSLLTGAMLGAKVNANENPTLYLHDFIWLLLQLCSPVSFKLLWVP